MSDAAPLSPEAYKVLADVLGGNGKIIAYRPYFAHAFGGACNALLLSQFWYWTNTKTVKEREGDWFWKTQKEITAETGLTRTETETARRKLTQIGVIEQDVCGVPATLHYRVIKDVLFEILWQHILRNPDGFAENLQSVKTEQNPQTGVKHTRKLARGNTANKKTQKPQIITDTTLEKTNKKTLKPPDVLASPFPDLEPDCPEAAAPVQEEVIPSPAVNPKALVRISSYGPKCRDIKAILRGEKP